MLLPTDVAANSFIVMAPLFTDYQFSFIVIHGNMSTLQLTIPDTIQSNVNIGGNSYTPGSTANVTLPVNGVLSIICSCDLTGVAITSDLPVSILSGGKKSNSPDGYIEAVTPLGTWGRKFVFPSHTWISETVTLVIAGNIATTCNFVFFDYQIRNDNTVILNLLLFSIRTCLICLTNYEHQLVFILKTHNII